MTSKNGSRMWKPASSVPEYLPSRSTTKALCCGTTTAVLATITSSRNARTTATITIGVNIRPRPLSPAPRRSLGGQPERQPFHPLDAGPLAAPQRLARPHVPRCPAQFRLAGPAGGHVLGDDRGLPDQRIDGRPLRLAPLHPVEQRLAEQQQRDDRHGGEQQPFDPPGREQPETREQADDERPDPEEDDEEAAGSEKLERKKGQTAENPDPPGHGRLLEPERLAVPGHQRQGSRPDAA